MPFLFGHTIGEIFLKRIEETPDAVGFEYKTDNHWNPVTFRQFHDQCRLVSFGLAALGVKKGDKVGLISSTRYEWSVCDLAILGCGAVTVPVYPSSTQEDIRYILENSDSVAVIVEGVHQLEKLPETASLRKVLIDPSAADTAHPSAVSLSALMELGKQEEARDPMRFERNLRQAKADDLITICYTSGTTGLPKGAMLTHANAISVLEDAVALLGDKITPEHETVLSFLPFSHILGKLESLAVYPFGWKMAFAEGFDKVPYNLLEVRPTILFTVPRVFEKAYERIQTKITESAPPAQKVYRLATDVGHRWYQALQEGRSPGLADLAQYQVAKNTVFKKVHDGFGGRLRFAVCGGAPLMKEVGEFFYITGIPILEGYGLTETFGPITLNPLDRPRFGSVGKPLRDVSIKIAEDGEILVKSKKVFLGYYKLKEESPIHNDWFHTGDIGTIDEDGFLFITDRKKDLIITSSGKNIAPQKIENLAASFPLISHLMVHGDRRKYLTALVTLNQEAIIRLANEQQILFSNYSELVRHPKIVAMVQVLIDELNEKLAQYEKIKKFIILARDFSVETGELTPSRKLRRRAIEQHYRSELDSMYQST